jgi:single-stranded DNA-binding protein
MLVSISGYVGRDIKVTQVPSNDGTSTSTVTDTALAVKVGDATDWFLIKFAGETLVKASKSIRKGLQISVVGELTFDDWIDEQQTRRSKPVVTVSDLQLFA